MKVKVLLCADSESLRNPELVGLKGEDLASHKWLMLCSSASVARMLARDCDDLAEIWVISSDSMSGINLAAALKRERFQARVYLISNEKSGSLISRSRAAGIDSVLSQDAFLKAYYSAKETFGGIFRDPVSEAREFLSSVEKRSSKKEESHKESPEKQEQSFFATSENTNLNTHREVEKDFDLAEARGVDDEGKTLLVSKENQDKTEGKTSLAGDEKTEIIQTRTVEKSDSQSVCLDVGTVSENEASNAFGAAKTKETRRILQSSRYPAFSQKLNENEGYVLTFLSGSGGCGKSTLSLMAGILAQNQGYRTLIFDADFQFGDLPYLMGSKAAMDVVDLFSHPEKIANLEPLDGLPALLCAPKKIEECEVVVEQLEEILSLVRKQFEVVVVNTGSFWTEEHTKLLEHSNQSVFVIDQRPSSVRACSHALELCARCGIAVQSFSYALNYCSKHAFLSAIDVSCALRGVRVFEIKHGGKEVGELFGAGIPLELLGRKNPFVESMNTFLVSTLFDERKPKNTPEPLFSADTQTRRFFRKRRRVACL